MVPRQEYTAIEEFRDMAENFNIETKTTAGNSPWINGLLELVFGQNPNLPSVLVDKPPALEDTTVNGRVGERISALHAAKKAFTEAECSERIRRAIRKRLRPNDEKYETGDEVYHNRVDGAEWMGPEVVIGQDGTVVFVSLRRNSGQSTPPKA